MSFWNRRHEGDLEHELRAQRPQPRDEFVRQLNGQLPRQRASQPRARMPKIALVTAATAVIAASLGVTGAFSYASTSVRSFGHGVATLVSPTRSEGARPIAVLASPAPAQSSATTSPAVVTPDAHGTPAAVTPAAATPAAVDPQILRGPPDWSHDRQYGHRIPICFRGEIIEVPFAQLFWYFLRGAGPVWRCYHPG